MLRHTRLDHLSHIAYQYGRTLVFSHHNQIDIGRRAQQAQRANQELLPPLRHRAAAGIGVGALQGGEQVADGQFVITQPGQVGAHLILADRAAQRHDIGNARDLLDLAGHRPVLNGTDFTGFQTRRIKAVAVDFPGRRGWRCQFRLNAGWQVDTAQALFDQLPGNKKAGLLVKCHHDKGQTELRMREHPDRIWDAGQRNFERDGDLLFHLLRCPARVKRNDRDLCVGHIGKSLDR